MAKPGYDFQAPWVLQCLSSRPKKVKPKGTVRELKLVHTINRHGSHIIKTEEVKTPKKETPSTSQHGCSSSPIKCQKLDAFDDEPIPFILEVLTCPRNDRPWYFFFYSNEKQCLIICRAKTTT